MKNEKDIDEKLLRCMWTTPEIAEEDFSTEEAFFVQKNYYVSIDTTGDELNSQYASLEGIKILFKNEYLKPNHLSLALKRLIKSGFKDYVTKLIPKEILIDLFSFSFELAKNEDEKVAEYGRLFIEYLLEQPDFPSVRKNYFSDEGDLYEWFMEKAAIKRFLIPIAKNVNCPFEILDKIVQKFDDKPIIKEAIKNDNFGIEADYVKKLITSDNESIMHKGFYVHSIKFPDNPLEFRIKFKFNQDDLKNDGVESLWYDTSAKDEITIKSKGGTVEEIFKNLSFLYWIQGIYTDASNYSVGSNFDSDPVPGDTI